MAAGAHLLRPGSGSFPELAVAAERFFVHDPDGRGHQYVPDYVADLAPDAAIAEDLRLLTSEIVTNAIRHTASKDHIVTVAVPHLGEILRVEVIDAGEATPSPPTLISPSCPDWPRLLRERHVLDRRPFQLPLGPFLLDPSSITMTAAV